VAEALNQERLDARLLDHPDLGQPKRRQDVEPERGVAAPAVLGLSDALRNVGVPRVEGRVPLVRCIYPVLAAEGRVRKDR
jgi:hypothetical protein